MIIKPLKTNILIAEVQTEKTLESGIILSGSNTINSKRAKVLAVGPDVKEVKVDDEVYVNWQKGKLVQVGNLQRIMIEEAEVIAVYEWNEWVWMKT